MEVFAGCSNRSTDSEHQSKKMGVVRSRFEKNAIRVCGDWSEQLSSKGKIYFYNCITEVSQWQKPSEWNLPDLEHNELVKVLSQRDSLDGGATKRPRLMCNTTSGKKDVESSRLSPKRSKTYEHLDNEKHHLSDDRLYLQRNVCGHNAKGRPPIRQHGYRESPKIDCNGSSNYTAQYCNAPNSHGKRELPIQMQRSAPPDDMEISPGSSPMSGGSSPMGYDNSHSPKRVKNRHAIPHRISRRANYPDTKTPSRSSEDKPGNSSHTLRQLIDAIRDSIGGLLDQSPLSTNNQRLRPSSSANGVHMKHITNSNEKNASGVISIPSGRTLDQVTKSQSVRSGRHTSTEHRTDKCLHSPERVVAQSKAPSSSDRLKTEEKGMSGLVSTLSTLVNLIGKGNSSSQLGGGDGCSVHTSTQSVRQPFTRPNLLLPPSQHRLGNQTMSSPLVPSPATPSAATGASSSGGSSGGTLQTCISSISTVNSIQQPDDAVSIPDRGAAARFRVSACASSHDMSSPSNIQRTASPRSSGMDVRDGHRLDTVPIDELPQERRQSTVEGSSTMDYSQSDIRNRISARFMPAGSTSPAGRPHPGLSTLYSPQSTIHKYLPVVGLSRDSTDKRYERHKSPDKPYPSLDAVETQLYLEPSLNLQYRDVAAERLEGEAQTEARRFDRLHSVLYGELSAESKTLRALVRISEAKLALHKEKQSSLQDLMDTVECHRQLPNPSLPDDTI